MDTPVWKFDKVDMVHIQPFYNTDNYRSHEKCYVTVDFGFFMVYDIGITIHDGNKLAWSQDFGWSRFKFMDSYIENPYGDEVRKLEIMVKNELESKKDKILDFMKGSRILSESLRDEGSSL